ncbi:MAG: hypothetical protein Q9166_007019 [cf. Caloplaca sp. 2 TL-2023]
MGCKPSKEQDTTSLRPWSISPPQGGPILIPPTRRDEQGRPIQPQEYDLSRNNLQRALAYVATYLNERNTNLTLFAVGGAVNTILLRSRDVTHDIDFINPNITSNQMQVLYQGASAALAQISIPLGENWLNNSTTLFLPSHLQNELGQEAIIQNEVVFQAPGLTVLAVPWRYALCAKLERMGKPTRRPYEIDDAVTYLHRHIVAHGGRAVPLPDLQSWGNHYQAAVASGPAQEVDEKYRQIHGQDGIIFE